MADCPYARCIQERKHIRRELLRWTKNMVFVVGLERVAEELMGRRKWKQYQDNLYSGTRDTDSTTTPSKQQQQQQLQLQLQQLAQAKAADSPSQALKAGLATSQQQQQQQQQQQNSGATTNCSGVQVVGGGGVEAASSPRRADESSESSGQNCTGTTGAPENGRLGEGARENGAAHGCENGPSLHSRSSPSSPQRQREHDDDRDDEDLEPALRIKRERLDDAAAAANHDESHEHGQNNHEQGTKEVKEETNTERIQVTQGLLRVKKEEELQETPGPGGGGGGGGGGLNFPDRPLSTPLNNNISSNNNNNGPLCPEARSASTPPKKEALVCAPFHILGRRPSPPPEDWKPLDKCYFCLDGKLQSDEQPPLSPQSESSNSSRSAESPMSVQVDPMAASVVAAALSGQYPTLLPQWCLPPREPAQMAAAAAAAAQQQHLENSGADQPLDLSAKPKSSQDNHASILEQHKLPLRMAAAIDPKVIFNSCYRAKPRISGASNAGSGAGVTASTPTTTTGGTGGRRTYTEDELQAALRDIQSGKLGTRRAAVLYGIPRSTLRNKVYKLAMERERDASLSAANSTAQSNNSTQADVVAVAAGNLANNLATAAVIGNGNTNHTTTNNNNNTATTNTLRHNAASANPQVDEVEDKELSGAEEEKEVEKALLKPLLSLEDLVRFSGLEAAASGGGGGSESLRALLQRGQESGAAEWAAFEHTNIGSYIQKMLAAAAPFKGMDSQDYRIPEVMRRLMSDDKKFNKEVGVNGDQAQHLHHLSLQHRLSQPSQRGPMTNDDFNPALEDEASDSGQGRPILKIPSYKPAGGPNCGATGPGGKNGTEAFGNQGFGSANASPGLLERASPAFSGTSSPTNSLVGKGMAVNFRDVIAKSISVKFQEGQSPAGMPGQGALSGQLLNESNPYKRGRFTPPTQHQHQASQQAQHSKNSTQSQDKQQQQQGKPATGGKGTRPKRGKYRNYDRDSLVEAVRAVQRGEMSVHRAGSYYGVPHSTLEYKVKERHLMRPRKRDQKQPDDKSKEPTSGSAASNSTLRPGVASSTTGVSGGAAGMAGGADKKPLLKPQKGGFGAGGAAAMPGPNGMKMPPFIEGMPHLPFPHPFNFWGPTPFMASPFMPGGPNVQAMLPEQYFASRGIRGLQEQQRNSIAQQRDSANAEQPGTSNARNPSQMKSPRESGDNSLYNSEGGNSGQSTTAANGSFLDNLIRSSLESKHPDGGGSKVLIEQLCRNSSGSARRTPLPRPGQQDSCSEDEAVPMQLSRPPTVELSPSPSRPSSEEPRSTASPSPMPLALARLTAGNNSTREDDTGRDSEVQNGGGSEMPDERQDTISSSAKKLNHYPDKHSLYAVSTDKKSACDSKLIVDHSSQKTQQQQQQAKDFALAAGGVVIQLTKTGNGRADSPNSVGGSASGASSSPNSSGPASPGAPSSGPLQLKAGLAEALQEPACKQ